MDFTNLYESLKPILEGIEQKRSDINEGVKKRTKSATITLAIVSVAAMVFVYIKMQSWGPTVMVGFTIMVVGYLSAAEIIKSRAKKSGFNALNRQFKTEVLPELLSSFNHQLKRVENANVSREALAESNLLYIKKNTSVQVNDVIQGTLGNSELTMARLTSISYRKDKEGGSGMEDLEKAPHENRSRQSFSGLMLKIAKDTTLNAYLAPIPKTTADKLQGMAQAFSNMKAVRDQSMTLEEQRSQNLESMRQGMSQSNKFDFRRYMIPDGEDFEVHSVTYGKKNYQVFFKEKRDLDGILADDDLKRLMEAENDLAMNQIDSIVKSLGVPLSGGSSADMAFAMHSGAAWVLIPTGITFDLAFEKKLNESLIKEMHTLIYTGLAAATILANIKKEDSA